MAEDGFVHEIAVRYGECDAQSVVFNATYLAYVDDAMDHWMRSGDDLGWTDGWDVMLKRAELEWASPLRWPESVSIRPRVTRWGDTSFDVCFDLETSRQGEQTAVATIVITYVSVDSATGAPMTTPPEVRSALGGPPAGV